MRKSLCDLRLVILHVLVIMPPSGYADPFTKVTSSVVGSSAAGAACAWGDFNNDGFVDLYVARFNSGPSLLYSNNGNGTFTAAIAGRVTSDTGNAYGAAWADYDNNGYLDLFAAVSNSRNDWLYHNNGGGVFAAVVSGAIVNSGAWGNNCSWGDYDNDGLIDLYVANSDQLDFLYRNLGNGNLARVTTGAIAEMPGNSQGGSWGDYDNDGLLDLAVSRGGPPNLLYHNEGGGVFKSITNSPISTDVTFGQGTSWGDYDNDGFLDLFLAVPSVDGRDCLYHNERNGTFSKVTTGPVVNDARGSLSGVWADYDNDGHLDLFVVNRTGSNSLYHNEGDGSFRRITNSIVQSDPSSAFTAAWADYDNNGFPDLFVSNLRTYNNALYRNNGNSNHWLTIRCEGRVSNAAAIGAKVRIKARIEGHEVSQLRELSGGGALGSQNDLRAQFGLGQATNADIVSVEWPSGIGQELLNVAADQFLTIQEPILKVTPGRYDVGAGAEVSFSLQTTLAEPFSCQWKLNGQNISGATNTILSISNVQRADMGKYVLALSSPSIQGLGLTAPSILAGACVFSEQPLTQSRRKGSNVIFTAAVKGFGEMGYQWHFNGSPIPGATTLTLTLTNLQLPDFGEYRVVASNSFGPTWSEPAQLIYLENPVIMQHPRDLTVVAGETAQLSVFLTGSPLPFGYRWRRNANTMTNFLVHATNHSLILVNVQTNQSGAYDVVITNAARPSGIISTKAVLTVMPDTDGDRVPDEWESVHGLDPTDPLDAPLDPDGDSLTNRDEYRAGTDPHDHESFLRITSAKMVSGSMEITFSATSNRTYQVQYCDALQHDSWAGLIEITPVSSNRFLRISAPRPADGQRFYRLVVLGAR